MVVLIQIFFVALLSVFASFAVFFLEKKGFFKSFTNKKKQIFIGILLSLIHI